MKALDLVGQKFGRWTVRSKDSHRRGNGKLTYWICECDCGKIKSVYGSNLVRGESKSCGCLSVELTVGYFTTHGMTWSTEYISWKAMKARCLNKNNPQYWRYGGRGITIHPKWIDSFEEFYKDLGPRPQGTVLDRWPNKYGNYTPSNCRWATRKQNSQNAVNNVFTLETASLIRNLYDTGNYTIKQLSEEFGVKFGSIGSLLSNRMTWT